jgi:hypothetical protein
LGYIVKPYKEGERERERERERETYTEIERDRMYISTKERRTMLSKTSIPSITHRHLSLFL